MFSRNAKPGMFWLGIASKEIFVACPTQFVFLIIRPVPGNLVMVTIDMCGKSSITEGTGYMELRENNVYFDIFFLFIVDATFILKFECPTVCCFCLDGHLYDCFVAIIVSVVVVLMLFCRSGYCCF